MHEGADNRLRAGQRGRGLDEGPDGGIHVGCDPHDKVRQEAPVFLQTEEFFRSGRIITFSFVPGA